MSSVFPESLDSFSTGHVDDVGEAINADTINELADAVNKMEREIGVDVARVVINVKTHYGAIGDGVADDTAAIQAAINEAASINVVNGTARVAEVYFPPGTYIVSTLVAPTDSAGYVSSYGNFITLRGAAKWRGSRLRRKVGSNAPLLDLSGTNSGTIKRTAGWNIVNLNLDANNEPSSSAAPLMRCYYNSNTFCDGVAFDHNHGPAVEGVEFQDSRFKDCWFNGCMGTVETSADGSTSGSETLRLLGRKDGNPASGTFGHTLDNCNNVWFIGCVWTSNMDNGAGVMALAENCTVGTGGQSPHRIYFINNKIELDGMKGDPVKMIGGSSRVNWIYFVNVDFTGYSLGSTATGPITWIRTFATYSVNIHNAYFDDSNTAGITHAPIKLEDSEYWSLTGAITTNLGAAAGGDTTAAALIHCIWTADKPIHITASIRHSSRNTPWFSGNALTRRIPPASGKSTQTPGAVTTVNIAHGLGYTPTLINVQPADSDARGAPAFYVTADSTNIILTFASALTAATAYEWRWMAS